jgi:glycosyltransferase involved in cell wall biosynthesis
MTESGTTILARTPPCLAVVIPVFNEASTIANVVTAVTGQRLVREIIIVDDASRDGTWDVLQKVAKENPTVRLFQHTVNQGKGAALRTGFAQVTSPLAIVQDADLEYDPEDYARLCKPILSGKADVVMGSRFSGTGEHRVLYYWHSVGNKFLTMLSNMAADINLSDMESGYKVFKREIIQGIRIQENRFGFEPEIVAKVSRLGVRIYEVPISYYGRTYAEGKKIGWRDGVSALRCIIRYNFLQ